MSGLEPTTSELVEQCLAGQRTAWEALLSRYERLIYYTTLRTGMTTDEAADVFQTVCLIWIEELGRLRDPERLGAWLVTTTRRECWARLGRIEATKRGRNWYTTRRAIKAYQDSL
jgi:DNA-directed RNA polymerase specialized sigma24 family protein